MDLIDETQLANTQDKLTMLKRLFDSNQMDTSLTPHIRDVTAHSLKRLINQLEEEIILYQMRRTGTAAAK